MLLRKMVLAGLGYGLMAGTLLAQGAPSDMLIPPALYAVVGAPFTAAVEWTSTETTTDGNKLYHRRVSRILRDSAGRQRFEDGIDEADSKPNEVPAIRLYDPTLPRGMFTSLDSTTRVAKISTMGKTSAAPLKIGATADKQPDKQSDAPQPTTQPASGVTREPLPSREIAGLHAEGVRITTTTPAEKDGTPAVTVIDEIWESPDLRLQLLHIHDDPRSGRSQAVVTELLRERPDEALFHVPAGYTKDNWEFANHFRVVLPKPSPLPKPILDDNLADAADRMIASATAHSENLFAPYHERYELTMVDYKGQQHKGALETWISPAGNRYEVHTDTYNLVSVTDTARGRRWESETGIKPLRIMEFNWDKLYPTYVEQHVLHSGGAIPRLKPVTVPDTANDAQLTCAGAGASAQICFDPTTGFMTSASLNAEHVIYEDWHKVDQWKYREGTLRILHDTNLLVEAKLVVASTEFSDDVFQQVDGLVEILGSATATTSSQKNAPEQIGSASSRKLSGYAQVRVWVDQHGVVTQAEVEDADDAQVAAAALEYAQKKVYKPNRENGQPAGFETTISTVF